MDLKKLNETLKGLFENEDVRTHNITVEVEVPHTMNNREAEEAIVSAIQQKYGDTMKVVYINSIASQYYNVGDRVLVWINDRVGTIVKKLDVDTYEVELDETDNYMSRIDTYSVDEMEPYNEEY